ncbi:PREDICTED: 97 kDa heat shock protein isoform X2 [Dinoponera quadriceps]|uniref:97 kDa heat shock protein isoform X2 n=1 Tax=Dinoponera quadriceps TaxID=609295 RepID=A0A6P3X6F8_DINQU|nr:PREDICTED: 97 kDa heat shock protein isoform X2 [Dinoponera quadriceps]
MAAMSVIGIDFGNDNCYVAVARAGGIETVTNDYSLRNTPSCVAFGRKSRILGVAAKNQMVTNMKNTIYNFKRLLGRKYNDPQVQCERQTLPFKMTQQTDGSIGIHVQYQGEEHVFSPEQITAMLFTKLKDISETALQTAVNDCVISIPSYFTQSERQALLDAARIAGLNVLRLFNETTATALCYGIYKQDLPAPDAPPRNVVFVDCGQAGLQVSICAFHKGKLKMLSSAADSQLGGRNIDSILAEHFCQVFKKRYNLDVHTNPRAYLRLLAEVEKLKKQMSVNSTTLPLNIECFMDEKDVHAEIKRTEMEDLCSHLIKRIEATFVQCLVDSKLKLEEIHAVELAGGSSRVPAIKRLVEEIFGRPVSTTLNQDESVARGCALQCAMLSPAVRVREFSVTDIQPYPLKLTWDATQGEEGEMEVFGHNHAVPFSKMLTFYRTSPFVLTASYSLPPPYYPQTRIGTFTIKNIRATPEGESAKVKVKVRVNLNGILTISSASLIEKREPTQQEKEEEDAQQQQQQLNNMDVDQQQEKKDKSDQDAQANEPPATEGDDKGDEKGKKKVSVRTVDLPIEANICGLSLRDLDSAMEKEGKMTAEDRQEKERVDARNALEEYVYDLRSKLSEEDQLATFITEADKESLSCTLDVTEIWLYDEGEDCQRQVYSERLTRLKSLGEPIKERKSEFEGRSQALEELGGALQLAKKSLDQIKAANPKDDKYSHLTEEEVKKIEKAVQEKWTWLEDKRMVLASISRTQQPPITVAQIRAEKQALDNVVIPILNKPKPKAEPPKEEKPKDKDADEQKMNNQNREANAHNHTNQQTEQEEKMDVE